LGTRIDDALKKARGTGGCRGRMPQSHNALFPLRSHLRLTGGARGVDQPGAAHTVPGLSATQKALLIRSWRGADRAAAYLAVTELIPVARISSISLLSCVVFLTAGGVLC
jgi:hypothetical protein